jgi:hypothetical protein
MIKNINKPTAPFWNKFMVVCTAVSVFIAAYGKWGAHSETIEAIGGWVGVIGVIIGVLAPAAKPEDK